MTFNSFAFLYFFALVYPAYLCLTRVWQNRLLLVASYVFYGYWDYRFAGLLAVTTLVDYGLGLALGREAAAPRRKALLGVSLGLNLGVLGFFKYWNFFAAGLGPTLSVVLPIGISFYTFQSLSYVIDVYRGKVKPERNVWDFALFISFFPQLVAGPIERASRLLPQMKNERPVDWPRIKSGVLLLLLGFFKKAVVADNLAPLVYGMRNHPGDLSGGELLIGFYSLMFFFYADFSGYSDMARGLAKLMGFELSVNFRVPLLALSPTDFWRRWHITLTNWFRDYVFLPLSRVLAGKSERSRQLGAAAAAILTLTLCGLWHGAAWNFVIFGFYHGLLLVFYHVTDLQARVPKWLARVLSIHLITLPVVFFMVPNPSSWAVIFHGILHGAYDSSCLESLATLGLFGGLLLVHDLYQERHDDPLVIERLSAWPRRMAMAGLFMLILLCGATGSHDFVYFQF